MTDLRCQRIVVRRERKLGKIETRKEVCGRPARFELVDWSGKRLGLFCDEHCPYDVPPDLIRRIEA